MPAMVVWWLIAAAVLPLAQDESYYVLWAKHLAFGYFDHPPLVALMAQTSRLWPGSVLAARLGTVIVGAGQLVAMLGLLRAVGITSARARLTAMLLAAGSILGFVVGFLTTPDTVLAFAWTLTLRETAYAMREGGDRRRWLTAGAAAGLGLMAKYTMGLYLFVAAASLIAELRTSSNPAIKTRWPWAGALVATLVFLPHLAWNASHDWITIRFQGRHGLALERSDMGGSRLPRPLPPLLSSAETRLAQPFVDLEEIAAKEERKPGPFDELGKALNRYIGFYGSQIGIWGALLPLAYIAWRRRREHDPAPNTAVAPELRSLMRAATYVPLFVFGILSLFSKVEANWSGMYVVGAAILATPYFTAQLARVRIAVAVNAMLLAILVIHARTGIIGTRPHRDRVLLETHGYEQLFARLTAAATAGEPVFADSFQITSMTRFYAPALAVRQWPGITRDSELIRSPELSDVTIEDLRRAGTFWLVTTDLPPPRLAGSEAVSLTQLRDCKSEGLQEIAGNAPFDANNRCKRPVHEWYLVRYRIAPI